MADRQEMIQLEGFEKRRIGGEPVNLLGSSRRTDGRSRSQGDTPRRGREGEVEGDFVLSDCDELSSDEKRWRHRDVALRIKHPDARQAPRKLTKSAGHSNPPCSKEDDEDLQRVQNDLLEELRATHRENREHSLELRELKRQNSHLREAYRSLRAEVADEPRKFSKHEKNKFVEHFQELEHNISYLQHELAKHESHIVMLTKQTREANREKDELEMGNRKLQRQIAELSASLTECKDDLLRLQPTHQTADSEISEKYSDLCQQVAGWVDDQTEDSETLEGRFEHLNASEDPDMDPIMSTYVSRDHLKLAHTYPSSVPFLLQYVIHSYLSQYILGAGIYFYGLEIRNVGLLEGIERGIRSLEPKRDAGTIRRWRTESLQGLLKVDDFVIARQQQGESLAKSLYAALSQMLAGSEVEVHQDGWQELHKHVIVPAIDLATAIRLSWTDYEMKWQLYSRSPAKESVIYHSEIQHYQLIDNTTHKIVRPDSILKVADDGRIGSELLIVSPALLRKKDGDRMALMTKPTILIGLDEPMGKRNKQKKALGWAVGWLGGDADVD